MKTTLSFTAETRQEAAALAAIADLAASLNTTDAPANQPAAAASAQPGGRPATPAPKPNGSAHTPATEKQIRTVFAKSSALGLPKPAEADLAAMSSSQISEVIERLADEENSRTPDADIPF